MLSCVCVCVFVLACTWTISVKGGSRSRWRGSERVTWSSALSTIHLNPLWPSLCEPQAEKHCLFWQAVKSISSICQMRSESIWTLSTVFLPGFVGAARCDGKLACQTWAGQTESNQPESCTQWDQAYVHSHHWQTLHDEGSRLPSLHFAIKKQ